MEEGYNINIFNFDTIFLAHIMSIHKYIPMRKDSVFTWCRTYTHEDDVIFRGSV